MASRVSAQGLENTGKLLSGIAGTTHIQTMTIDNSTGAANAITSAFTALNTAAAVGSFASSPTTNTTIGSQTIRYEATFTTATMNGTTLGRYILHHGATAAVTSASATVHGGIDQQSVLKTSEFGLILQLDEQFIST